MPDPTAETYEFGEQLTDPAVFVRTSVRFDRSAAVMAWESRFAQRVATGWRVGIVAVLYDSCRLPQWVWTSVPLQYELHASSAVDTEFTGRARIHLDREIADIGKHLAIKHFHSPTDPWSDIKDWIRHAEHPDQGYPIAASCSRAVRL